jgi:hypothetical protein
MIVFSYLFFFFFFFVYAPYWFGEGVIGQLHLVSVLAGWVVGRLYLDVGWGRVIWVDADVYICDQSGFNIGVEQDHWVCDELWATWRDGDFYFSRRANNAILAFSQGNKFLDFYRHACQKIVRSKKGKLRHTEIGTSFLAGVSHLLPQLKGVAIFSPFLLAAFYKKNETTISRYLHELASPIKAVNLCLTFRDTRYGDLLLGDDVFAQVIESLDALSGS